MKKTKQLLPIQRTFQWSYLKNSCLAFCYPRTGTPFVIKGEFTKVHNFLTINAQPILAHYQIYSKYGGKKRKIIPYGIKKNYKVEISNLIRYNPSDPTTYNPIPHKRHWIVVTKSLNIIHEHLQGQTVRCMCMKLRSIPRKWIQELNSFTIEPLVNNSPALVPSTPSTPITPKIELTPQQKKDAKAIAKSHSVMSSVLKRVGVFSGHNLFEVNEVNNIEENKNAPN